VEDSGVCLRGLLNEGVGRSQCIRLSQMGLYNLFRKYSKLDGLSLLQFEERLCTKSQKNLSDSAN